MEGDFRIGDWLVRPETGAIKRGDQRVTLEPKVMDVLVYLAKHAGEVLPKERIIQAVWPDTFVTDEVLTNAISELRKAFGDNARNPRYIHTLPRRGYRVIAAVSFPGTTEGDGAYPILPKRKPIWVQAALVLTAGGLVGILGVLLFWQWRPTAPRAPIDSIAVLPFVNATGDASAEHLSLGIAESIAHRLSKLPDLRVIPSSNLRRYRDQAVTAGRVSSEVKTQGVLQGELRRQGETLSISVELADGRADRVLWGERYNRRFSDVFDFEREIASKIVAALRLQLGDERWLARQYTKDPEAYEAYLKGQLLFLDDAGIEGTERAIAYFKRAIELDPDYAMAYVGLSRSYDRLGFYVTSKENYRKARETAEEALRLDDTLAEAHIRMATVLGHHDRDWEGAEREFQRATDLDPGVERGHSEVYLLLWLGRRQEAIAWINRRAELADPLSALQQLRLGTEHYYARDFDRALEYADKSDELKQTEDRFNHVLTYLARGMEQNAFEAATTINEVNDLPQASIEEYRQAFANSGMRGYWRLWLEKNQDNEKVKPYDLAAAYAYVGQKDQAFAGLEKTFELPAFVPLVTDARFDSLRDDPRYEQLLRRLNLPQEVIAKHLSVK